MEAIMEAKRASTSIRDSTLTTNLPQLPITAIVIWHFTTVERWINHAWAQLAQTSYAMSAVSPPPSITMTEINGNQLCGLAVTFEFSTVS